MKIKIQLSLIVLRFATFALYKPIFISVIAITSQKSARTILYSVNALRMTQCISKLTITGSLVLNKYINKKRYYIDVDQLQVHRPSNMVLNFMKTRMLGKWKIQTGIKMLKRKFVSVFKTKSVALASTKQKNLVMDMEYLQEPIQ